MGKELMDILTYMVCKRESESNVGEENERGMVMAPGIVVSVTCATPFNLGSLVSNLTLIRRHDKFEGRTLYRS